MATIMITKTNVLFIWFSLTQVATLFAEGMLKQAFFGRSTDT
jgi:hypothetical protein